MVEEFIYPERIEEIKPLVLSLTLSKHDGKIVGELRKKFLIKEEQKEFWVKFFNASLQNKPINAKVQIVFRDKLSSACTLKELGLLKKDTVIKE
jgi:hypothetical protein